MGDQVAEDLFILAARTGKNNVRVVIAPADFRQERPRLIMYEPRWVSMLYASLHEELMQFPQNAANGNYVFSANGDSKPIAIHATTMP